MKTQLRAYLISFYSDKSRREIEQSIDQNIDEFLRDVSARKGVDYILEVRGENRIKNWQDELLKYNA